MYRHDQVLSAIVVLNLRAGPPWGTMFQPPAIIWAFWLALYRTLGVARMRPWTVTRSVPTVTPNVAYRLSV